MLDDAARVSSKQDDRAVSIGHRRHSPGGNRKVGELPPRHFIEIEDVRVAVEHQLGRRAPGFVVSPAEYVHLPTECRDRDGLAPHSWDRRKLEPAVLRPSRVETMDRTQGY